MRAMVLERAKTPLVPRELATPEPDVGQVLVKVGACGVCRTDLHVVDGELTAPKLPLVPGHEIVGRVAAVGRDVSRFADGDRVGIPWLGWSCGQCRFCREGRENLCADGRFTGWTVDGGYAEFAVVSARWAHRVPDAFSDEEATPLLCAGIIGYRALTVSGIRPGGRLGLYGFGGSAHIAIQVARHRGCEVFVCTRDAAHRDLARKLGASWVGGTDEPPPAKFDAAILFAPAGSIVPAALDALDWGGTLAVAGIHLSEIPPLEYERHLFHEKVLRCVTANTREDAEGLLREAAEIPIRTHTRSYALEDANEALLALREDRLGAAAAVLAVRGSTAPR
jgi:alcohol dehydrogenase, propanol-preferring